jgi:hypothetical protein
LSLISHLYIDKFKLIESSLSHQRMWSFRPLNPIWFVFNDISTSPIQGLGQKMILLWLNFHNDLDKIPNLIIYDWRKIHHDRKDSKVVFSYVILVYKRKKRKGSCTTYFREEYSLRKNHRGFEIFGFGLLIKRHLLLSKGDTI